jgi:hypothetical protein
LGGNINANKKTTEVLLDARWKEGLEDDAGTAVSSCVISVVLIKAFSRTDAQLGSLKNNFIFVLKFT